MSSDETNEEVAEVLDARNGRSALSASNIHGGQHSEIRGLLEAADLAWESQQSAPPLAADPIAAMLGLVPDPDMELDGKALTAARKRAGLTVSDLAARLTVRGWEVSSKDLFAWESGRNAPQVAALINALAEEVGADADGLRRRAGEDPERVRLAAIVASPAFKGLAERWARVQSTTLALATSALESRMLVAVHRGGAPDAEVLLESLEAMVSAVEGSDKS
jgi:transcriptional regulator with XRE-family HTH domain